LLECEKINELTENSHDIELLGKITAKSSINHFTRKDGSEGTVASFEIVDETGKIRITLWDEMALSIDNYQINDIVRVIGGRTRVGMNNNLEVHLGKKGRIIKDPKASLSIPEKIEAIESSITPVSKKTKSKDKTPKEVRLAQLDESMRNISVIARVSGISTIREFTRKDGTTSSVGSVLVKDNSGPGRITFWGEMVNYLERLKIGDVIRLEGAYVRPGLRGEPEVQVNTNTVVEINPEYLMDAVPELTFTFTKIADLEPNDSNVNLKIVVMRVPEIRMFSKRDGSEGKVLNIGISDETGATRLVAWDQQAEDLSTLEEMTSIEILHGYTKEGNQGIEVHLGSISTIRILEENEALDEKSLVSTPAISRETKKGSYHRVKMVDLSEGQWAEIRGTILKIYENNLYYQSCPECRKKVTQDNEDNWVCKDHGRVTPKETMFVTIALDDGTGCVRVTFFRELAEELLERNTHSIVEEVNQVGIQPTIVKLEQKIKGREIVVKGRARKNKYDDGMDLLASSLEDFNLQYEIDKAKSTP
jgi:replication factor A1